MPQLLAGAGSAFLTRHTSLSWLISRVLMPGTRSDSLLVCSSFSHSPCLIALFDVGFLDFDPGI